MPKILSLMTSLRLGIGGKLKIISIKLHEGKIKPPNRLTEAELLKLMEENGIGTDATRATYPKLILDRGYAIKEGVFSRRMGLDVVRA